MKRETLRLGNLPKRNNRTTNDKKQDVTKALYVAHKQISVREFYLPPVNQVFRLEQEDFSHNGGAHLDINLPEVGRCGA